MDVEFLIERLERYILEESPKLFGVRAVNEDEVRTHLTQLRAAIPDEVPQAREIVAERDTLLNAAHQEAQQILAAARTKAEQIVTEHRLVQEARQQAEVITKRARRDAVVLRSDADEYVFNSLSQLQAELNRLLHVVDNGLQKLEADREQTLQLKDEDA
jgi:cell division septum initiation protein DivIVA